MDQIRKNKSIHRRENFNKNATKIFFGPSSVPVPPFLFSVVFVPLRLLSS